MDFLKNKKEDPKAIKILAGEIKSERKMNNEDPGQLLSATQAYALYGKDSRFLREMTAKQIEKITAEQFSNLFNECLSYELNLAYVGTKPGSEVTASMKKVLEVKAPAKTKLGKKNLAKQGFDSPKVYFLDDKKAVQSQINFVLDGAPMKPDVIGNMKAFNLYFGADMSSLVFQEIREFRSLAYSTSARYQMADKPGLNNSFYAYVGCQGDKTPEAIQVMSELITNMPVKREREDGIRSSLISDAKTSRPGFRELIYNVEKWEEMGFSQDPNKNLLTYFSDLSFDQIEGFYSQEIKGRPMQLFIVGNSGKFDTKILEKYGKVIKVKPTQVVKN